MRKVIYLLLICSLFLCCVACAKTQAPTTLDTEPKSPTQPIIQTVPETEPLTETIPSETELVEETTLPMVFSYTVYIPNENADGFIEEVVEVHEVNPESVLAELQKRNVLPEDVVINSCSNDEGHLTIDFNQAFADVVCSMGTSGELMVVGSVVNTYLSALGAESLYFTINGEILESGHTVYDFVMSYFSLEN